MEHTEKLTSEQVCRRFAEHADTTNLARPGNQRKTAEEVIEHLKVKGFKYYVGVAEITLEEHPIAKQLLQWFEKYAEMQEVGRGGGGEKFLFLKNLNANVCVIKGLGFTMKKEEGREISKTDFFARLALYIEQKYHNDADMTADKVVEKLVKEGFKTLPKLDETRLTETFSMPLFEFCKDFCNVKPGPIPLGDKGKMFLVAKSKAKGKRQKIAWSSPKGLTPRSSSKVVDGVDIPSNKGRYSMPFRAELGTLNEDQVNAVYWRGFSLEVEKGKRRAINAEKYEMQTVIKGLIDQVIIYDFYDFV